MQVRQPVPVPVRKAEVQKEDLDAKEQEEMKALVGISSTPWQNLLKYYPIASGLRAHHNLCLGCQLWGACQALLPVKISCRLAYGLIEKTEINTWERMIMAKLET